MKAHQALFIVLEGSDGSGKTTQFKLLAERLRAAGHEVDIYDFPRYDQPSSYFVQRYLNGEYGPASDVSPYTASLFYALDRFEAAPQVRQSLADGKIVLANRYTGSNMAHQGSKFANSGEQRGFFMWADSLEFELLGIPRPSINIFLRVPAEAAYKLIKKKAVRSYTVKSHDEHEADIDHLRRSVSAYDTLCQLFPKDFKAVDCTKDGKILSITEINNRIWEILKPMLPEPPHSGRGAVVRLNEKPTAKRVDEKNEIALPESFTLKSISLLAVSDLLACEDIGVKYSLNWPGQSNTRQLYYMPSQFSPKLSKKYRSAMDKLIDLSRQMTKTLERNDKARSYLEGAIPLSALVNAQISGSPEAIRNLLARLRLSDLEETSQLANRIDSGYAESAKRHSDNRQAEPEALKQIIRQIADTRLPSYAAEAGEFVKLLEYWPRNELELLFDCLYPHSNLGRDEIAAEVDRWTYEQKAEALKTAARESPDIVLANSRYRFDVVDDRASLDSLLRLTSPTQIQLQPPTPRYGYHVPEVLEQAAVDEQFIECFDLALGLFSEIQTAGDEQLAGYAVLSGHRQRWQFSTNADAIFKNYPKPSLNFLKLIHTLREKVAEVHPLIGQAALAKLAAQKNVSQVKSRSRAGRSRSKR